MGTGALERVFERSEWSDVMPCSIERIRDTLVVYKDIVLGNIRSGLVAPRDVREISLNEKIQDDFKNLIGMIRRGGAERVEAMQKIDEFSENMKAGWMVFYIKYHCDMYEIELPSRQ